MRLSQVSEGRDNNFNFIRIAAALAVLFSHSFNLATGIWDAEPLARHLGMSPASIAVDVFFITSGFLVTGSLLSRSSVLEFVLARIFRIFPALLVMVILTVFGLGLYFTKMDPASYLQDPQVWKYLVKNTSLFSGIAFGLPGVFESNPFKYVVNGSLWTLTAEVQMYAILAFLWVITGAIPVLGRRAFGPLIVSCAYAAAVLRIGGLSSNALEDQGTGFFFMFFSGSAYYLLKDHVILSRRLFGISAALLALCAAERHAFFVVYNLTIAYIVLLLAYVPAGRVRQYNALGDYSYGVYIYAFPIQQAFAASIPGISIGSLAAISAATALVLAGLSWHLLEERALASKGACIDSTRRLLGIRVASASDRTRQ
jgi:peptidoglycan/LPS O-acetylase OafA/YrhL